MEYREAVASLRRLQLLMRIKARSLMADSGLHPGQPRLMEFINGHPGCTQKEAADELDVTPASAAASLKRLEKAGMVARMPDTRDARRNRLYLTEAAREKLRANQEAFRKMDAQMFAGLTDAEVQDFCRICQHLFDNLADESCRRLTIWKLAERASGQEKEEKNA
ncbi:MAG: MarR family transcriptional regulator [Clostridia bacterium]|nr:MarR family transcriptional regulator [Clostridia bacterium]